VKTWLLLVVEPLQYSPVWAEPNVSTFAHCLKTAEQTCGVSKNQRQETHLFSALSGLPSGVSIVTQHETMYRKKNKSEEIRGWFFQALQQTWQHERPPLSHPLVNKQFAIENGHRNS